MGPIMGTVLKNYSDNGDSSQKLNIIDRIIEVMVLT